MMENYIVLCKSFEEMKELYDDMETPGGSLYIPDRAVVSPNKRALSLSTVYTLTEEEVLEIRKDPRVVAVEKEFDVYNSKVLRPTGWTQYSNDWDKEWYGSETGTEKNWGLKRCTQLDNDFYWGYDGDLNGGANTVSGTVTSMYSGYNVDVVIIDGHIDANHPEFAVNPDGTGGSRVVHLDWDIFTNIVNKGTTFNLSYDLPTYTYNNQSGANSYIYGDGVGNTFTDYGSDHGMHVAGTVAGNTQGWARGATIYNISPYSNGGDPNAVSNPNTPKYRTSLFDYIKAFHLHKPVNPITGRQNPTIINGSYGGAYALDPNACGIIFRGNTVSSNAASNTIAEYKSWGLHSSSDPNGYIYSTSHPTLSSYDIADISSLIDAGVIVVVAAGNAREFYALPNDSDYDNSIEYTTFLNNVYSYYYCRGEDKAYGGTGGLAIGNVDAYFLELKSSSSARGPNIDVWAPGSAIMSSVHEIGDSGNAGKVQDPRNSSYYLTKLGGTSMASPQVAGVLACLAEQNPDLTHEEAREWVKYYSNKDDLYPYASANDFSDSWWLGNTSGESNRLLYLKQTRYDSGQNQFVYKGVRPTSGISYPRPRYRSRIRKNNLEKWYPIYVGYATNSSTPNYYRITGVDANGTFNNRLTSSTSGITMNAGEAVVINNFWGSGELSTNHPLRISSSIGGAMHSDVTSEDQRSYTFIPTSPGTYYFYCYHHTSMVGRILVN